MSNANMQVVADKLARGEWSTWETVGGIKLAAIRDIMISLRAIRRVLECENVQRMALSTQGIDKAIRLHLAGLKKKRKPKRKAKVT